MSMERHTVAFPGLGIEPFQLDRVAFTIPGIDWPVYWRSCSQSCIFPNARLSSVWTRTGRLTWCSAARWAGLSVRGPIS